MWQEVAELPYQLRALTYPLPARCIKCSLKNPQIHIALHRILLDMALSYVDARWPKLRLYLIQNTTLAGHFWSWVVTLVMQSITPV